MQDKLTRPVIIIFVIIMIINLFLGRCEHDKELIEEYEHKIYEAEEKAYERGYKEGEIENFADAYAEGYSNGYDDGEHGEIYDPSY